MFPSTSVCFYILGLCTKLVCDEQSTFSLIFCVSDLWNDDDDDDDGRSVLSPLLILRLLFVS